MPRWRGKPSRPYRLSNSSTAAGGRPSSIHCTSKPKATCSPCSERAIAGTVEKRAPNLLCEWAFALAQDFNSFYQACHILSEDDAALRGARLALVAAALAALDRVFALIGIERPARM